LSDSSDSAPMKTLCTTKSIKREYTTVICYSRQKYINVSPTTALCKDTGRYHLFIHPSSICPHYGVSEACLNSQNGSNVECKPSLVLYAPDLHLGSARFESRPGHRVCDVSSWFLSVPHTKAVPHASNRLRPLRYKSFLIHESSCHWRYAIKDTDTIVK